MVTTANTITTATQVAAAMTMTTVAIVVKAMGNNTVLTIHRAIIITMVTITIIITATIITTVMEAAPAAEEGNSKYYLYIQSGSLKRGSDFLSIPLQKILKGRKITNHSNQYLVRIYLPKHLRNYLELLKISNQGQVLKI